MQTGTLERDRRGGESRPLSAKWLAWGLRSPQFDVPRLCRVTRPARASVGVSGPGRVWGGRDGGGPAVGGDAPCEPAPGDHRGQRQSVVFHVRIL